MVVLHLPAAAGGADAAADEEADLHVVGSPRRQRSFGRGARFQGGVGVGVGGEATGGVDMRLAVQGGREARDLLVLSLRFLVASACGRDRR